MIAPHKYPNLENRNKNSKWPLVNAMKLLNRWSNII